MAWERTGTVSVTNGNNVVTGANTKFATNCRVGDGFIGPDGTNYEVSQIASETQLTINPVYKGPTSAGSGYAVIPVQGYDKLLSDQVYTIVGELSTLQLDIEQDAAAADASAASALASKNSATASQTSATQSAAAAADARDVATARATAAGSSATAAAASQTAAKTSETNAKTSETNAKTSETNAKTSETNAASTLAGAVKSNQVGVANGVASLGADVKVPAAQLPLTTSTADNTVGRIMKVGDWGFGSFLPFLDTKDLNNYALGGRFTFSTPTNGPSFNYGILEVFCRTPNAEVVQIAYDVQSSKIETRRYASSAWSAWQKVYTAASLLGTVSQTAGVPTGSVIETGTNANGTYTKYACGTMICHGTTTGLDQTAVGNAYSMGVTLPAAFINTTFKIFTNIVTVNVSNVFNGYSRTNAGSTTTFSLIQSWSVVQTYSYSWFAIGRWF